MRSSHFLPYLNGKKGCLPFALYSNHQIDIKLIHRIFALHEVMPISEEIERLIIERRSVEDLSKVAQMEGMIPLRQDGLRKAAMGMTSIEEIFRVVT